MKELKIGKHKVVVYEAVEDLPILRYHRFNKYMIVDAGLGTDISVLDEKITRILNFLRTNSQQKARTELLNLRQSIYLLQEELTPKHLAFATLVQSIDGQETSDLSEEGLMKTMSLLNDVPVGDVAKFVLELKKKLDEEIVLYAPKLFDDSRAKEYYSVIRARTIAFCNALIEGRDPEEDPEVLKYDQELNDKDEPMNFYAQESQELKMDKDFEYACLTISQHLNADAKKFTVLEYYNALNYIQDLAEHQKKENDRRKRK